MLLLKETKDVSLPICKSVVMPLLPLCYLPTHQIPFMHIGKAVKGRVMLESTFK